MSEELIEVGEIGNYYGGLSIKKEGCKFFWGIENWDDTCWEEISESLYLELIKHNEK